MGTYTPHCFAVIKKRNEKALRTVSKYLKKITKIQITISMSLKNILEGFVNM